MGNLICPSGIAEVLGITPWNGALLRFSSERGIFMSSRVLAKRMLSPLPKFDRPDDRIQHQGITTWVRNVVRMVGSAEGDWCLRPFEIFGGHRSNCIDLLSDELSFRLDSYASVPPYIML